jgi:hypothetical protein
MAEAVDHVGGLCAFLIRNDHPSTFFTVFYRSKITQLTENIGAILFDVVVELLSFCWYVREKT